MQHYAKVLCHSSILLGEDIFIDPYNIKGDYKAKVILITHNHYDHFSPKDIDKIISKDTLFIASVDVAEELKKLYKNKVFALNPYQEVTLDEIKVETFPSYNVNKNFHKKEYNWLGYKIDYRDLTYAILGDCDENEDNRKIKCDVLLLPIGGVYTMDGVEAGRLAKKIAPKLAIPTHYNLIVGSKKEEADFIRELDGKIDYEIHIK